MGKRSGGLTAFTADGTGSTGTELTYLFDWGGGFHATVRTEYDQQGRVTAEIVTTPAPAPPPPNPYEDKPKEPEPPPNPYVPGTEGDNGGMDINCPVEFEICRRMAEGLPDTALTPSTTVARVKPNPNEDNGEVTWMAPVPEIGLVVNPNPDAMSGSTTGLTRIDIPTIKCPRPIP